MARDKREQRGSQWSRSRVCSVVDAAVTPTLSRRSVLATTGAGILGGVIAAGGAGAEEGDGEQYHLKSRPTMWTEEMRENARANIDRYEWAANERDDAAAAADAELAAYGPDLESLWHFITSQEIPRAGAPAAHRDGVYGGYSDSGTDRPWKIETAIDNPHDEGNFVLPTNDFEAYRESGRDDRGMFDPDLADDDLLVNEEHPEMGEGWGVDDGYGWIDEDDDLGQGAGTRYNIVAFYNHWLVWRPGGVNDIVPALADAYLLTGESEYAVAGLVLLDRIADVYPEMDLTAYTETLHGFWNNHGGMQTGRIQGSGWEPNTINPLLRAYDAFFPALDDEAVADELLSFLGERTDEYPGLDGKESVADVRENIEENFLQEVLVAAENSDLREGRGQRPAVALSARVQDDTADGGYTREALEWLFQPGGEIFDGDVWDEEPENWLMTGGEVLTPLVNEVDRDGYWNEGSLGYNRIEMSGIRDVAEVLLDYDGFDGADLYEHPKFQHALKQNAELLLLDEFSPALGNTHHPSGTEWSEGAVSDGYEVTGDSLFAQLWHYSNGYSTAGIRGSIYEAEPEGLDDEIQAIIDADGPLDLPSQNLAGFGFAALRDGENYAIGSVGVTLDTSDLFADSSAPVDDSFEDAIQFEADEADEWWTFEFDADGSEEYELEIDVLFADTYGTYELSINDEYVDTVDFMADGSGEETLTYQHDLEAGTNTMRWDCIGRNDDAGGYSMALYSLTLLDEDARDERDGADLGNAKRAVWMYYGRNGVEGGGTSHAHRDTLQLGVAAHEMELSRDLGYPEATGNNPQRDFYTDNTISHNTVVVNERGQEHHWVGTPRHFDGGDDRVNLVDVEAPHCYEETDEYRRTTATITVDEEHSYAVDFFRVAGGDEHRFGFHGTKADVSTEGLELEAQDGGTLAGPDVPYADDEYDSGRSPLSEGSGLNYFDNVERDDDPADAVAVDWDVADHFGRRDDDAEDVHLRLTSFGEFDTVELADGYPPDSSGGSTPEPSIRYAFLNREGSDLESTFTSVIEHYEGERAVESIEDVDVSGGSGRALRVDLANGRTDYVVCSFEELEEPVTVDDTVEFQGFFGVLSLEDGEPENAYVHDGTLLGLVDEEPLIEESAGHATGFVESFTREMSLENELTVRVTDDRNLLEDHTGFVYVDNDRTNPWRDDPDPRERIDERDQRGRGNGAYPIEGLEEGRGNLVTVDVGDKTFTRDFVDSDELEDGGYHYVIHEDDDVRIPRTTVWTRS